MAAHATDDQASNLDHLKRVRAKLMRQLDQINRLIATFEKLEQLAQPRDHRARQLDSKAGSRAID
jgi:hypothetical protein